MSKMPIYMDHQATTPVDERVVEAIVAGMLADIEALRGAELPD